MSGYKTPIYNPDGKYYLLINSDGSINVRNDDEDVSTATGTSVTVGSSSTTVLAANTDRVTAIIVNDSNETIYLKYGNVATMNSGIRINSDGGSVTETSYTGIITGICSSGGKVVTVTEL